MNFGMDGPSVTGWWYNPTTGDKFNAIDTYFEDNNLLIKTADGRLLNYGQVQNYVHVERPELIPDKPISKTPQHDEVPAEVLAEIDNGDDNEGLLIPGDNIYGRPTKQSPAAELGNIYNEAPEVKPEIQDFAIIDRALTGKDTPSPVANIFWDNFPRREIEMLVDVMNISEEQIIQYYINKISVNDIKDMVAKSVREYIERSFDDKGGANTVTTQYVPETGHDQASSSVTTKTTEVKKKTTTKKK